MTDPTNRLLELDERHNRLLEQLADLDRQASAILDDWTKAKQQREQGELIDQALIDPAMDCAEPNGSQSEAPPSELRAA